MPHFLGMFFVFRDLYRGHHLVINGKPSALTLLANDSQRACALPVAAAAVRRSVHASLYRCIRCKWAARQTATVSRLST